MSGSPESVWRSAEARLPDESSSGRIAPRQPTVALVAVGDPASAATWSGVTAGILAGLRALDVAVRTIDLTLSSGLEQLLLAAASVRTLNRYDAEGAPVTRRVRSALAARRLRGPLIDGAVQIGTTYALRISAPYVTLEDMTLIQAASSHPVFSRMSARAIRYWERDRAQIYRGAAMCTTASHWAADSLRRDYGLPASHIGVVGFGANHRAGVPERDWHSPRFLFVGIDWQRKGGPHVLDAFARVRESHPSATLDLVGGHPSIRQAGVTCHGVLSQSRQRDREVMATLFARATCFVMPSLIEPFGIVYVEAASAGIPCIASSIGGGGDVVGEAGGVVVEPGDERALAAAMLRLADPDTAKRMGDAARLGSASYTWTRVAERLLRSLGISAPDGRELAHFL